MKLNLFVKAASALLLLSVLLVSGCATGKVTLVRTDLREGAISKSSLILVKDFDMSRAVAFGDGHESKEVVETHKARFREEIAVRLVRHLEAQGFRAQRYSAEGTPRDATVIDGRVVHNDRGSWALRVWLGSGATSLRSVVRAHSAASPDTVLMDIDIEASSSGSHGWWGIGDFIPTDSENTAIAIANYVNSRSQP